MWNCDGHLASWRTAAFSLEMDLSRPNRGISEWTRGGVKLPRMRLLSAIWQPARSSSDAETIEDCYPRGRDLIVTYAQTPERSVRPQVYWRVLGDESNGDSAGPMPLGVEWIGSMQTSFLDSQPQVDSVSEFDSADWKLESVDCYGCPAFVARPTDGKSPSILIAAHPSDCQVHQMDESSSDTVALRFRLFTESLEKGVIRRGRIRAHLLDTPSNEATIERAISQFLASEPPLTT